MFKCESCTVTCGEAERTGVKDTCYQCVNKIGVYVSSSDSNARGIQTSGEAVSEGQVRADEQE